MIDVNICNAWLLYRRISEHHNQDQPDGYGKMPLLQFRIELAKVLTTIGSSNVVSNKRDEIEYKASQLTEIEKREEGTEELINSNSDPPIPTQPLIFEFLDEKTTKLSREANKPSNATPVTLESSGGSRNKPEITKSISYEKVKTRSTSKKQK
ncbi:hypothetical protein JTB14_029473 [Gonioctena quinquepunctata]|nr:hypothetical protein JTB14_029473 [Gonioctena quinquepunctata]